ncbi:MAG: cation diffusion facilitator family transporter [Steroidobacteraceae bacterium]
MGAQHKHTHADSRTSEQRLWIALALTCSFLVVEVVASLLTGSLALLSDAGHMATDVAALGIALLAIKLGRRPADSKRSFGYRRLEILAAALNAAGLFLVAGYVLIEAVRRFGNPQSVDSTGMLVIAALGLVVNAVAMMLLKGGRDDSLNVRGAYLEVWADFLGSVAVLLAAAMIWLTGKTWIDPTVAILIALWVLPRGWQLLKSASQVLLEGTPEGLDPEEVKRTLLSVSGIKAVHDLHIWSVTTGVPLLSAHLEISELAAWNVTLAKVREELATKHRIDHVTLQPEVQGPCVTCS